MTEETLLKTLLVYVCGIALVIGMLLFAWSVDAAKKDAIIERLQRECLHER